jgi:PAS domain S-box-containing protein
MENAKPPRELLRENEELRARLEEAEETLRAISSGEIDAVVAAGPQGDRVFTLKGADHVYRIMVEQMSESAVTVSLDGVILFANANLSALLDVPDQSVLGRPFQNLVAPAGQASFDALLQQARAGRAKGDVLLGTAGGKTILAYLSLSSLHLDDRTIVSILITDLSERQRLEDELKRQNKTLAESARELEEMNTALRILLDQRGKDRLILQDQVLTNMRLLIAPYLARIRSEAGKPAVEKYLAAIERNFEDITSAFSRTLSSEYQVLTGNEIRVADLIRDGLTSKDIAAMLHISPRTADYYRASIRRKLGPSLGKNNLRAYLTRLSRT